MSYAGPVDAGRLSGDRRTTYERRILSPFTGIVRVKGEGRPSRGWTVRRKARETAQAEEKGEGARPLELSSAPFSAAPFFAHR